MSFTNKKINLTCNITFWILMVLIAYFAENVVLFDKINFQRSFSTLEYLLLFFGIVVLVGHYFYNEYKYNEYKPNKWIIIFLIIFGIGGVIGLILTPTIQYFTTVEIIDGVENIVTKQLIISTQQKVHSFLFLIIMMIGIYLQLVILPRLISFKRYLLFLLYTIVFVALLSIFLSYFLDRNSYIHLFNYGLEGYIFPTSFLFNRNMYALLLMLGALSLYYIISLSPKWYNHVILFFIIFNMLFTFSKASIGITLITFIVNFIYRMIVTYKKHRIRNVIFIFLIINFLVFLVFSLPLPGFDNLVFLRNTRELVYNYFIKLGPGTFNSRTTIWDWASDINNGHYFYFGRGLTLFNESLLFYTKEILEPPRSEYFSHNGFVEIFGQFGIYGLILYILGIIFLAVIIVYVAIQNREIGFPSILILIAFLFYTMVETSTLFDPTVEGIVTTTLVALPSLSWLYHRKNPLINKRIIQSAEQINLQYKKTNMHVFARKTLLYATLFLGCILIFMFYFIKLNQLHSIHYFLCGGLTFISLFSVLLITYQLYKIRLKQKETLFWILFILSICVNFGLLLTYLLFLNIFILILGGFLITIGVFISLLINKKYIQVYKRYIQNTLLYSFLIYFGFLLIFTPLIYFEIISIAIFFQTTILIHILLIPFVNKVNKFGFSLNDRMLLVFAKNIKY